MEMKTLEDVREIKEEVRAIEEMCRKQQPPRFIATG